MSFDIRNKECNVVAPSNNGNVAETNILQLFGFKAAKNKNHKPCVQDPLLMRNSSNAASPKDELPFIPSTII